MENQKIDPRTRKTKKAIRKAFAQLLTEKEFEEITVIDIAAAAEINRKTFYNYYDGVFQLVDEIENEIVRSFDSVLCRVDLLEALKKPIEILKKLNDTLDVDQEFYKFMVSIKTNVGLVSKINKTIKERTKKTVIEKHIIDDQTVETILEYAISGMISVYKNWYLSDRSQPIETLFEIIGVMYSHGIGGILENASFG